MATETDWAEVLDIVDDATVPSKMTKREAQESLTVLRDLIDERLECIRDELENEEG